MSQQKKRKRVEQSRDPWLQWFNEMSNEERAAGDVYEDESDIAEENVHESEHDTE